MCVCVCVRARRRHAFLQACSFRATINSQISKQKQNMRTRPASVAGDAKDPLPAVSAPLVGLFYLYSRSLLLSFTYIVGLFYSVKIGVCPSGTLSSLCLCLCLCLSRSLSLACSLSLSLARALSLTVHIEYILTLFEIYYYYYSNFSLQLH